MLAAKSSNALIGLIYKKQFKLSAATNKKFTSGEIINFVQSDATKLFWLSSQLPTVANIPFLIVFCTVTLFIKLGYTFVFGIIVLVLGFYYNLYLSQKRAKSYTRVMKLQDQRLTMTT